MIKRIFLQGIALLFVVTTHAKFHQPNVIIIYTDDQGYGDVSALNPHSRFNTPNLDRLANEGIAFTHGHSADSVCTPSRYGLLTGRYAWRTKLKKGVFGAENKCLIPDERMTLGTLFQNKGYHTAMVGKWHLGMNFPGTPENRDWSMPVKDMPLDKGFDYFYGIPASLNYGLLAWFEGRYAATPPMLYTNKKKNPRHMDYRIMPPYENLPDNSVDPTRIIKTSFEIAEDFIDNQCLTRFTDKAVEWIRNKKQDALDGKPFFLYLPLTSPHYPVCPLPKFHGQGMAGAYGEFVIETDHHVGRILSALEKMGLDGDTLILFTSDNGPEYSWKGRIKEFSHDSRGGLKEGKRSVYEGGHRVPFLIRWPNGIQAPGRSWDKVVGQVDLLATFAELIGAKLPDSAGEDSQSFASVLFDRNAIHERQPLISHGNDGRYAITKKEWKLIMPSKNKKAELYHLLHDRSESQNMASTHPVKMNSLTHQINTIIKQGRTTPGPSQSNDTDYWKDLIWMTREEYRTQF